MAWTWRGIAALVIGLATAVGAHPPATADVDDRPKGIGNTDGAPIAVRYQANQDTLARLATDPATPPELAAIAARWRGAQVLAFDPAGRGRLAVVLGDLHRASSVAVVVPGSDVDLARFDNPTAPERSPYGMATALANATSVNSGQSRVAVVAWLGYDTPEGVGLDAASGRLAERGARSLVSFVAGLRTVLGDAVPIRLFCHSYGTVVCGLAAARTRVDDIVFTGSPGVRARTAAELGTTARVWAARADDDWIGWVPNIRLGDLGHGTDPTDPAFGARRFGTAGAHRHEDYYRPGTESLRNLARIALGETAAVRA
ncbi:alpha/beta hydrolase [Goodfellowiella coeruleoviolacea]|uniref:Alpha/beta hydrolase n=1 Tax=Goodfellowiella coeruleoviolacea TaxID=334858 RepID=A0AAE3KJ54_9PSEU|nr:alpha/beta hydrolase [Goodfellowiella coeruleoviolacea]MCP2168079.1 Alpha/beta hydrolase [Goodfellowiella coeruleoviolacea]